MSVSHVGLRLLSHIAERPGALGTCHRIFPFGAMQTLAGTPELLPLAPPDEPAEVVQAMAALRSGTEPPAAVLEAAGVHAWTALVVLALNFSFCGGARLLMRGLAYPVKASPAQDAALSRIRTLVRLFVTEAPPVELRLPDASAAMPDGDY